MREDFYLCYEGNRLIGVFSLKFELTEFLLNYGGHIGYATRPSDRKRGLATQMLKQGLELSKELGFERILCVCDSDNYCSAGGCKSRIQTRHPETVRSEERSKTSSRREETHCD